MAGRDDALLPVRASKKNVFLPPLTSGTSFGLLLRLKSFGIFKIRPLSGPRVSRVSPLGVPYIAISAQYVIV